MWKIKGVNQVLNNALLMNFNVTRVVRIILAIGGLQPISRDTDNNAAIYNCWWTNKRS